MPPTTAPSRRTGCPRGRSGPGQPPVFLLRESRNQRGRICFLTPGRYGSPFSPGLNRKRPSRDGGLIFAAWGQMDFSRWLLVLWAS